MSKQLWFARLNAAWRYKWIMVIAIVAGVIWGVQSVLSSTPLYRATLTLLLEPEGYYAESTTGMSNFYSWKSVATQHALIQSRSLSERVVDDLGLVNRTPLINIPERTFQSSVMNWAVSLLAYISGVADVVIDGDLRKPKLAKVSNIEHPAGLAELIIGTVAPEKCIVSDPDNRNLSLLSHGMIPPDPLELLNSIRFENLLEELKQSYKHIVIDTSPVLPVSDPIVLAHRANGLLLVIEANKTTHWTARMAVKKLAKANVNMLGLVLSKMDSRRAYYYSNYRNYHESYYSVDDPRSKGRRSMRTGTA